MHSFVWEAEISQLFFLFVKVLLVIKPTCPFSVEAKRTLDGLGVKYAVCDLASASNAGVHDALKKEWKQSTVPYVFIGGVSVSLWPKC